MKNAALRRLVSGLGITQLIAWGASIYAIAVLGAPMAVDLHASETAVFGAFSLSLAVSGLVAPRVGSWIDRAGGRRVLAAGSLLSALSLAAVALSPTLVSFVLAWCFAGIARAMTLYEAAFATLSQHATETFRKSVTAITLVGGLAGSAAFPLSLLGLAHLGWRGTLLGFAAAQFFVCLPLHLWCVPAGAGSRASISTTPAAAATGPAPAVPPLVYGALATSFALTAFITSALSVHVINLLRAAGLGIASAVMVASLIGPMQVAGRIVEFVFGARFSPRAVGAATLVLMLGSLLALRFADAGVAIAVLFATTFGWSNGVNTIIRGTVPAELFGHEGYGRLIGRLAFPSFIARAIAPIALTLPAATGIQGDRAVLVLLGAAVLALATYVVAIRAAR